MSKTVISNEGGDDASFSFSAREQIAGAHLHKALYAIQVLVGSLARVQDDKEAWKNTENDGGARMALTTSLIKTCDRLDRLVDDDQHWSLERALKIEQLQDDMVNLNKQAGAEHIKTQQTIRLPRVSMQPSITFVNGKYVAHVGQLKDRTFGVGDTPAEALQAFDEVVLGQISVDIQYAKLNIPSSPVVPPAPQKVVQSRGGNRKKGTPRRGPGRGHSPPPGPNDQGS